jgi:hypothetical protein
MGKGCVRFKSLEDLALDVVGRTVARVSAEEHMANYQAARALMGKDKSSAKKGGKKSAVKNGPKGMSDMAGKAARKRSSIAGAIEIQRVQFKRKRRKK